MNLKAVPATILMAVLASYATVKLSSPTQVAVATKEAAYDRVMRTGVIRCGYGLWPPLVLNKEANTGRLHGLAKDIIEAAAKNLNLKVEWVEEVGGGDYPTALNSGRFDLFCGPAGQTAKKGRTLRYTMPVFFSAVYAYARLDDRRFDQDLFAANNPAIRISGMDGEVSELIARNYFPKAVYVGQQQMSELGQIFMDVAQNKADIVFNVPDVAEDFMQKNPSKIKRITDKPFQVYNVAYAMDIHEGNLQQILDTAFIEMRNNGQLEKILQDNSARQDQFLRLAHPYSESEENK